MLIGIGYIMPVDNDIEIFGFAVIDDRPEKVIQIVISRVKGMRPVAYGIGRSDIDAQNSRIPSGRIALCIGCIGQTVNHVDCAALPVLQKAQINQSNTPQDDHVSIGVFDFIAIDVQPGAWRHKVVRSDKRVHK